MQMRVYRHDPVEERREKARHGLLADRLAFMEGLVLPHVAEIRRDENETLCASAAKSVCGKHQIDEPRIRPVQRTVDQGGPSRPRNANATLTIGKCVDIDQVRIEPELRSKLTCMTLTMLE
ncbi:MAG: hypothetical protein AMXMBFR74_05610 [Parvibaculum sp.]